ncbi:hypothetical protein MTBBW1_3380001 [Desulfamplus magnetovallimortis]|uniref:Uncharacterized protein n=1 Tax=Desulfamplus magnetovallimortis TaxID=1246637 RepID=A0A1W1HG36_9BACT|nr:hypothetical protein MTBBW1_3380001 [Desulfamplus magnetovallimortis]
MTYKEVFMVSIPSNRGSVSDLMYAIAQKMGVLGHVSIPSNRGSVSDHQQR